MRTRVPYQYGSVYSIYLSIIHSNKITQKENNNRTIGKYCFVIIVKKKMFSNLRILYVRRIIRAAHLMHKTLIKINKHAQENFYLSGGQS